MGVVNQRKLTSLITFLFPIFARKRKNSEFYVSLLNHFLNYLNCKLQLDR
jgi:hypothetical protein